MKILLLYGSILLFASCNLFQGKQQAGESVAPTEEPQIQTETSAKEVKPTEKELLETMGDTSDTKAFGKYFTIEKVSKQEYLQALKQRYYFLTNDNLRIEKQEGVIELPCENKTITFEDTEASEEFGDAERYDYLGEMSDLNQYVVRYTVYRVQETLFIDKQTGNQTKMEGEPILSLDRNYVIGTHSDVLGTFLMFYKVKQANSFTLKELITVSPQYWTIDYSEKEAIFFSKNNYLYISITFKENYNQREYIKIGIRN